MANTRTHNGDASGVDLTAAVSVNTPASNDARNAASVQQAIEPLSDVVEAIRQAVTGLADFGDGSDGAATFDGSSTPAGSVKDSPTLYHLARDVFYTDMTVGAGIEVRSAGFRIYVNGTLDMSSAAPILSCDGGNASNATGGTRPGASGILGTGSAGAGANGGVNAGNSNNLLNALGGSGGSGGTGSGSGAPGTSAANATAAADGSIHILSSMLTGLLVGVNGNIFVNGGAGGGGGQGSGALAGGGGGAGGGVLLISARIVNLSGTAIIRAKGGNGGQGGISAGGGGGGGGGAIIFCYRTVVSGSTAPATAITSASVPKGTGGNGGAGGSNGADGSAGAFFIRRV